MPGRREHGFSRRSRRRLCYGHTVSDINPPFPMIRDYTILPIAQGPYRSAGFISSTVGV